MDGWKKKLTTTCDMHATRALHGGGGVFALLLLTNERALL
jgi:hypothetical protein